MEKTKRELIFEAGAELFAERSFNSVGIRDIAKRAGANSAMISYYFGGKSGLLKEIFSRFSELILSVLKKSLDMSADHYELCENNVRMFLESARQNRSVYLVGLRELNRGFEELKELRQGLDDKSWELFSEFLERVGLEESRTEQQRNITFTAVMGLIFSDYLLGGGSLIDNDDTVDEYADVIIAAMQHGFPSFWK